MRKNLGVTCGIFPMPVLMIATYNEDGSVDVMNAAWGTMVETNIVALNLTKTHKTVENILRNKAFTVSFATKSTIRESDYFGMVSGNRVKDKFEKSGFTALKSECVNAPLIAEYPLTLECEFIEFQDDTYGLGVIGEVKNVSVDENYLDENGKVNIPKVEGLIYDTFNHGYYVVKEKAGQAFSDGKAFFDK